MASIPTSKGIQMRDRIFVLPNLVLWASVWLLAIFSDLEDAFLVVPFCILFLVMSAFLVYDLKKKSGWPAAVRPLWNSTPINRYLLLVVLIIVISVLWFVSMYYTNLSWLGWNTIAAFNLAFSYTIIPTSSIQMNERT